MSTDLTKSLQPNSVPLTKSILNQRFQSHKYIINQLKLDINIPYYLRETSRCQYTLPMRTIHSTLHKVNNLYLKQIY